MYVRRRFDRRPNKHTTAAIKLLFVYAGLCYTSFNILPVLVDNPMLSTNTILRQGRYRIIDRFASNSPFNLYDAYDNLLGNKVVIHETLIAHGKVVTSAERNAGNAAFANRIQDLKDIRHDGIVRVRDGFAEIDRQYLVTEPVEARPSRQEFLDQPVETISRLLLALEHIGTLCSGRRLADLTPLHFRRTSDGNNRLLYFGPADQRRSGGTGDREDLPYKPLESFWSGLDHASQNVISKGYDDSSLETLGSAPDIRSSIYCLGASIYYILTRSVPVDALERSIEILDGKQDPLVAPAQVDPAIPKELSDFLITCLQLKREDRFQTIAEARIALVVIPKTAPKSIESSQPSQIDEFDFLEVPATDVDTEVKTAVDDEIFATIADTSTDEDFLFSEPAEIIVPERITTSHQPAATLFSEMAAPANGSSNLFRNVSFAVAGIAVVAGIAWGVFTLGSNESIAADTEIGTSPAIVSEKPAAPIPSPSVEPVDVRTIEPEKMAFTPAVPANEPDSDANSRMNGKARPVVAENKRPKLSDPAAPQKPAAKPKKSLTVDDLINDN